MTDTEKTDAEKQKLLWNIVTDVKICMIATHSGGRIHVRPMRGRADPDNNAIWFVTDHGSAKEEEIIHNSDVCLIYADISNNSYVSLSGSASIIDSEDSIIQLWDEKVSTYFSVPYDRKISLIKVTPDTGEYWDVPGNKILVAIKFIEASITGKRPDLGNYEKIHLG